jgi:hypothetical protein
MEQLCCSDGQPFRMSSLQWDGGLLGRGPLSHAHAQIRPLKSGKS